MAAWGRHNFSILAPRRFLKSTRRFAQSTPLPDDCHSLQQSMESILLTLPNGYMKVMARKL
eukprot:scaffold397470_cov28-Prasinocladus_malaysianus.AAC.2